MAIIYVVSGFVGLLLVVVAARGFCVMRDRLREVSTSQSSGWIWQQGLS